MQVRPSFQPFIDLHPLFKVWRLTILAVGRVVERRLARLNLAFGLAERLPGGFIEMPDELRALFQKEQNFHQILG